MEDTVMREGDEKSGTEGRSSSSKEKELLTIDG